MDIVVGISVGVLCFVFGLFAKNLLPAYAAEKGRNLATKEDIEAITRQIEGVKLVFSKDLELTRGAISSQLGIRQHRYQREFEMLVELSSYVLRLQHAALDLRNGEWNPPADELPQQKTERLRAAFWTAHAAFLSFEPRRPFVDPSIGEAIDRFSHAVEYEVRAFAGNSHDRPEQERNSSAIVTACQALTRAIRARVRVWEEFDDSGTTERPA